MIPLPEVSADLARRYGPLLETHANFPSERTRNFKVIDRTNIRIEIGSARRTHWPAAAAAALGAVARRLGFWSMRRLRAHAGACRDRDRGRLSILMTGPVTKVAEGTIAEEMLDASLPSGG